MTLDLLIRGERVGLFKPGEIEACDAVFSAQLPVSLEALQAALSLYCANGLSPGWYLGVPRQLLIDLGVIRES